MDYATRAKIERNSEKIVALERRVELLTELVRILISRRKGRPSMNDKDKIETILREVNHGPH